LDRIARNATTVVCPVIDVISDDTLEYHYRDSGGVNVGGFDWNLQFSWHPVPDRERKRHNVSNINFNLIGYNGSCLSYLNINFLKGFSLNYTIFLNFFVHFSFSVL